ncbi:DUF3466 family protein [Colwellia sp. 12G3]|uniref:DUF3466 family protein n=1 Tax=Colwellia sp. 12G3 TaxID=2058299 RepID=UPI000C31D18D|nr:DUF3466 family protein [Colwellia sp. 12G3]PKI17190.1 hypothetical protein CXF71_05370 [Colwellia sp. 12G3]
MKPFSKNILALTVISALSLSLFNYSHAETYRVVDKKPAENLGYTYGGKLNNQGNMAVTGSNVYNFPVQFDYFDETDFNNIVYLALSRQDYYFGLGPIEDLEAMKIGEPTANDLAWAKLYLEEKNKSNTNFEYQIVADTAAMINLNEGSVSTEICVFDTDFTGTACSGEITRSTVSSIEGFNNSGVMFGTATAPYLPLAGPADSNGLIQTHWVRAHGQRGFFSPDFGETIIEIPPEFTEYGGGISAIFDINDNGIAVGYSSYKLSEFRENQILDETGGCADPAILATIPFEVCVQKIQSGMYHVQAFKATLSADNVPETEQLGLLITPHADDDRAFSSQALAVNNHGVAVGYAHGWNDTNVTTPAPNERMGGSYAVIFKDGKVSDFNQLHYNFNSGSVYPFSRANDINDNGLVVGYTRDPVRFIKKLFYVDTSVPESEMEIIIPKDFFTTSVSTAFAVNASGVIVGEAQIESHNESANNPRRTTGFMFDTSIDSPVITDINTLLKCDSPYNIIKANDINDVGQISATAIVKSASYDTLGKPVVDDSGNPVMIDVVRAVLLEPIEGGEVTDCGLVEEKIERQGASISSMVLFSLLAICGFRRRRFKQ